MNRNTQVPECSAAKDVVQQWTMTLYGSTTAKDRGVSWQCYELIHVPLSWPQGCSQTAESVAQSTSQPTQKSVGGKSQQSSATNRRKIFTGCCRFLVATTFLTFCNSLLSLRF